MTERDPGRLGAVVLISTFAVVVSAVALEVAAGMAANSPTGRWASLVPLTWPPAARVLWWLLIAGAAAGFRWSLRLIGFRANRLVDVVSVAPFVVFAAGIASEATWATWH